jgi:hypothetical protein
MQQVQLVAEYDNHKYRLFAREEVFRAADRWKSKKETWDEASCCVM